MRDLLDILAAVREFDDRGKPYAVATVVKVAGSTYRRPGARMFLSETDTVGAVSGGCLENDVREHASQVIASGKPKVVRYDTSFENDTVMGLG
ncbi:MAG TPA: xanthine dehydrogenase, partial [Lentisphaeria bacterium]|nr:xanthine dehydrogenase [Lentisphaeria bacterium]